MFEILAEVFSKMPRHKLLEWRVLQCIVLSQVIRGTAQEVEGSQRMVLLMSGLMWKAEELPYLGYNIFASGQVFETQVGKCIVLSDKEHFKHNTRLLLFTFSQISFLRSLWLHDSDYEYNYHSTSIPAACDTWCPNPWTHPPTCLLVSDPLYYFVFPEKVFLRHSYNTFSFCHSAIAFQVYSPGGASLQYASYYKLEIKSDGGMSLVFLVFWYLAWPSVFTLSDVYILAIAQHNERQVDRVERSWFRTVLEKFICKEPDRKYFRLCRPDSLCHNYSSRLL